MKHLVELAWLWANRCFGHEHCQDLRVRAIRLAEEAVELCQSVDVPKEKMEDLISIVYGRPKGVPLQELGGVLMTTAVFSRAVHYDMEGLLFMELARVLEKPTEHFAKRNQDKLDLGLTGGKS